MKSYLFIIGIIVLVAVFGMFSFWPNIMEAHYGGSVSCPLISMGDSYGCQNMSKHLNDLAAHISDFFSMISAILMGGIFSLLAFCAVRLFKIKDFARNIFLLIKSEDKPIRFLNDLGFIVRSLYVIFFGLRRGIINTKVF